MISNINYTKENPYELRWRFDFDDTLLSVCNINGDYYDINNLSEEDKNLIEMEYEYLKSISHFIKKSGCLSEEQINILKDDTESKYIDYVNIGWINPDNTTYSFIQKWITQNGIEAFDYSGEDAPLSKSGLFNFSIDNFPCYTRCLENGTVYMDYREVYK